MKIRSLSQPLFGILLVSVGVGFLLDVLNVLDFSSFIGTWWPLLVIAVGVLGIMNNPRQFWWPLLIVAVGALLLLNQLNIAQFNAWQVIGPLALIVFGLSLSFGTDARKKRDTAAEDKLQAFAALSGQNARVVSQKFEGGTATALLGGIDLDLTDAKLKGSSADLELFTFWGGIEIRVPETWAVKVNGLPIMGGWEDKTSLPKNAKNAPVLNVHGTCVMGGVTVKNGK